MISSVPYNELFLLLKKQINNFFPFSSVEENIIKHTLPIALNRCEKCFDKIDNKYFKKGREIYFSPFHSGQWLTFLYFLYNSISTDSSLKSNDSLNIILADKLYYLNKIMNGVDIYHEVSLPDVFFFEHPLGTVIGRAKIGNGLVVYQGCTIGGNSIKGEIKYPCIGSYFKMFSNSKIIGDCHVGNNVTLAANAYVKDSDIPNGATVFGQSPNLIIKYL